MAADKGSAEMSVFNDPADLRDRFHEAIRNGQIRAYFQPVIRSLTSQMVSAEALARWFRPDGSMLSPADFIPELEAAGLITELDLEILRQACALYAELQQRGTPVTCMSVNLSRLDFDREDLVRSAAREEPRELFSRSE